ncbi:hypothetical protein L8C07_19320 [Paenibacillus sp. CMAA1739]|uniref:hypothetical protein n=1 Tax=Paenibacillus ottowii TaxID=2315729 RepID=UPI0027316617|nr:MULTISPECIES: hypothetical protein [Paenibacillus]MDP1510133.1 hypothetical protein [Paenibacillus ottowii]MEC4568101.1 hypothetical protein [Paenibacillus sp. CMAA1739]
MGLLPLDPSRVGQMRRIGCCLVVVRAVSRVFSIVIRGSYPQMTRTRFGAWPPLIMAARARPGLFASQRRERAGQRSEQRQRVAYFFAP